MMKQQSRWFPPLLITLAFLAAGCKTTPKVDWDSRIGTYTYDQAVVELGPPDKTANLDNGGMVAEWITGYKQGSSISFGTGVFGGHGGMSVGQTVGGGTRPRILRLTFDQENRLLSWARQ